MMILVGVGLALENGNVLLCRRSGDRELSGWWELPGGKVEGGGIHPRMHQTWDSWGITEWMCGNYGPCCHYKGRVLPWNILPVCASHYSSGHNIQVNSTLRHCLGPNGESCCRCSSQDSPKQPTHYPAAYEIRFCGVKISPPDSLMEVILYHSWLM